MDTYEIVCEHFIARGLEPPTREWWDFTNKPYVPTLVLAGIVKNPEVIAEAAADQREIDRELAEGWAADRRWWL